MSLKELVEDMRAVHGLDIPDPTPEQEAEYELAMKKRAKEHAEWLAKQPKPVEQPYDSSWDDYGCCDCGRCKCNQKIFGPA